MKAELDEEGLAGFFNAEGNLEVLVQRSDTCLIRYRMEPRAHISQKYVAWYINGEGCFYISVRKRELMKVKYDVYPKLQVGSCDIDILEEIKAWLLTKDIEANILNHSGSSSARDLRVVGIKNVKRLLDLILPHLRGAKRLQALILYYEILPRMEKKLHTTQEGFLEIMRFADVLNNTKGGQGKSRKKYTYDYFAKLWC